jgi:hypothetical protein
MRPSCCDERMDMLTTLLANLELYHVWMRRADNEVVKDEHFENFKHLHIQWWVPMKKGAKNDRKLY